MDYEVPIWTPAFSLFLAIDLVLKKNIEGNLEKGLIIIPQIMRREIYLGLTFSIVRREDFVSKGLLFNPYLNEIEFLFALNESLSVLFSRIVNTNFDSPDEVVPSDVNFLDMQFILQDGTINTISMPYFDSLWDYLSIMNSYINAN